MTPSSESKEVQVTRVVKVPALTAERLGHEDLVVVYTIGGVHQLKVRITNVDASEQEIKNKVLEDSRRFANLLTRPL